MHVQSCCFANLFCLSRCLRRRRRRLLIIKLPIKTLLTHAGEGIFLLFAGIFFKLKGHGNLTDFTLDNNETIKSVIPGEIIFFCDSTGIKITAVQRPMSYQNGDLSGQKLARYYSRSRMHTLIL